MSNEEHLSPRVNSAWMPISQLAELIRPDEDLNSEARGLPVWDEAPVRPAKSHYATKVNCTPISPELRAVGSLKNPGVAILDLYERQRGRGPLVESNGDGSYLVTFLYKGDEETRSITMEGGPTISSVQLNRFGRSDIWYYTAESPRDAMLMYWFNENKFETQAGQERIVDVLDISDELNPTLTPTGCSVINFRDLPPYSSPGKAPRGHLRRKVFTSELLGQNRCGSVYLPLSTEMKRPAGIFVFFDGEAFCNGWPEQDIGPFVPTPVILDHLVETGQLPYVAAAFIDVGSTRDQDLVFNEQYAKAAVLEFLPQILEDLHLPLSRDRVCFAGASYGGLCAAYCGLRNLDAVGNVLSLSGSYWVSDKGIAAAPGEGRIQREILAAKSNALRFFLEVGAFEGLDMLLPTRHVRDLLKLRGFDVTYREYPGNHDYMRWQVSLADGLTAIARDWID